MVVYLDILLLENFLVNMFLLRITCNTIKKNILTFKLFIAAVLGSLYVIVAVMPYLKVFTKTPFKILIAFMMILLVVGYRDLSALVKGTVIFILYSMLLAGVTFYLTIQGNTELPPGTTIYNFSYKNILLALMILYLVVDRVVMYVKERRLLMSYVYDVEVILDSIETKVKAFLDTGNELREPVTNLPVVIVEKNIFKELDISKYNVYSIPYCVVGGRGGTLVGIKPDSIKVNLNGEFKAEKMILAFSDNKLSKNNDYNGLLPRGIIE